MNIPIVISEESFQVAWAQAVKQLSANSWDAWNLVVQINNPELFNNDFNTLLNEFAKRNNLRPPKHVAHTIFPQRFYIKGMSRNIFYRNYFRFFNRPRDKPRPGWGAYFKRMIKYQTKKGEIDQLGSIIDNINNRAKNYKVCNTIVIPSPDKDLNRTRGGPCLNYIAIQPEVMNNSENTRIINLLAVYRNHDFTNRAYGNYMGLCNLIKYIAYETNSKIGKLSCISSHAYFQDHNSELQKISNSILGETS